MRRGDRGMRGLVVLPLSMAACLIAGLLLALLGTPAWQPWAWALLAVPPITFVYLCGTARARNGR